MASSPQAAPGPPLILVTTTVMLGLIMAIVDATIVNVALPTMAGNLGATVDEISWIVTGYILATVIVMPLNGWLTARLGRRRFYAASLAIFTIASFLCGTARSVWLLVLYRVLQGFGGGALQPTAQAILFESYPPQKRGAAMAIFGLGAMVGPALGPTLGGYLVDNASWPLIFYINLPIGIAAFLMTLAFIRDPSFIRKPEHGIDWFGLALLASGLAALQYVLERGQREDWFSSPTIVLLSLTAIVTLTVFVWRSLRQLAPLVELQVFRFRTFTMGNIIGIVTGFGLFGLNLILPLFFQNVLGLDAWHTGLALLPGALATALSMGIVGRLVNLIDNRIIIAVGMAFFGWSAWWLGMMDMNAGFWDIWWPRALQGFALGFIFVPLSTVTLAAIPRAELANATGVSTLLRQLGGSLGIAILTTLLSRKLAQAYADLAANVTAAHGVSPLVIAGLVQQNATVISYDFLFRLSAIVFFLTIPVVFFMRPSRKMRAAEAAAELAA